MIEKKYATCETNFVQYGITEVCVNGTIFTFYARELAYF